MEKESRPDSIRKLREKRRQIDLLDRGLLTLLNQRVRIAMELGKIKKEMGKKIYDPRREKEVLDQLKRKNRGPVNEQDLEKIFKAIIKVCRRSQA